MSGTQSNKRLRTKSGLQDRPVEKRPKTNHGSDVQGTSHGQRTSATSKNIETIEEGSKDAKGGRSLRPRQTKVAAESEEEEDNSADESWTPDAAVTNVQKPNGSKQILEKFFQCTDQCIEQFFAGLGIVVYFQNPPPPILCTKVHDHTDECVEKIPVRIVASNVTQAILAFYARWVFADTKLLAPQETTTNTAANIYKPIPLIASHIPWDARPFTTLTKNEDGTFKLDKDAKLDRDIRAAWWWFLRRLINDPLLKIPLEWTCTDDSLPSDRPEMPEIFWKLLEEEEPVNGSPHSACSSLDGTPLKKGVRISLADNGTARPLNLDTIHEQEEACSPLLDDGAEPSATATPALSLPYFELEGTLSSGTSGTTAEIKLHRSEIAELSDLPAAQALQNFDSPEIFKLAHSLIEKHELKETKEDALRLEQYLADAQRKFDINQSKRQLCAILGPAEKHTVLDGNFANRSFAYVPKADIEKADELERCGNAGRTENAVDVDDTAMELNIRWLSFKGINETSLKGKAGLSELDIERKVGRLFVGLFRFDELQESANLTTGFIKHLELFHTSPRPDYAVRPAPEDWSHWPKSLLPIMASGDMKTRKSKCDNNAAQLAFNTRAVIILQILMHLDTRQHAHTPLPAWMFNLAWIANHRGFTVYAHYPGINIAEDGSWSWKMVSVKLTDAFANVWIGNSSVKRQQAKAAFDMIVSHTSFVLDQIRKWSRERGYYSEGSIMNRLIARAHLDEENYDWLYRKMKEGKKEVKKRRETATEVTSN